MARIITARDFGLEEDEEALRIKLEAIYKEFTDILFKKEILDQINYEANFKNLIIKNDLNYI